MTSVVHYLRNHYSHLMTSAERRAGRLIMLREKSGTPQRYEQRLEFLRQQGSALAGDDETDLLLADGEDAFWAGLEERLLGEHADEIVLNKCRRCNELARTPVARQCLGCGHDWH